LFGPPRSKQKRPTAGFIYSPAPLKGSDIAMKALLAARDELAGLRALVFSTKAPLPALALPSFAEFTLDPAQPRIRELYNECDVFLQASRTEGFGLPILEAMACRTPVVATPAGAAPAILRQGGGKLVPHDDPNAMAAAIVEIASLSDAEWRNRSEEAYRVATSYSWDDATSAFEAALEGAVKGRKAARSAAGAYPTSPSGRPQAAR
jgi:glycosyltransferase involved in cell wall biosynthesis